MIEQTGIRTRGAGPTRTTRLHAKRGTPIASRPVADLVARMMCVWAFVAFTRPKFIPGSVVLIVALGLLMMMLLDRRRLPRVPFFLAAFAGLAMLSARWAELPTEAFLGGLMLLVNVATGAYVAEYLRPETFLRTASAVLRAIVVISVALALAMPAIGIEYRDATAGSLIGVFPHRNILGYVITLAAVAVLWDPNRRVAFQVGWAGFLLAALAWTGSSAALVTLIVVFLMQAVVRFFKRHRGAGRTQAVILLVPALSVVVFAVIQSGEALAGALGRDLTFTGRTDIWRAVLVAAREHLSLGWGYSSAFDEFSTAGSIIFSVTGWVPTGAHNGYLTTLLQLGLAGLVVSILALLQVWLRIGRCVIQGEPDDVTWFGLTVLAALFLNDAVETRMFIAVGIFLMAYIGCAHRAGGPRSRSGAGDQRMGRNVSTASTATGVRG